MFNKREVRANGKPILILFMLLLGAALSAGVAWAGLPSSKPTGSAVDTSTEGAANLPAQRLSPDALTSCTITGTITNTDPIEASRVFRSFTGSSSCAAPIPCQPASDVGPFHYDVYTYTNTLSASQCITIGVHGSCATGDTIMSAAYLGSFDPANACSGNYLGATGLTSNYPSYSVTVPAGASFVVVVNETASGVGCPSYNLTVTGEASGPGCAAGAATATSTATAVPISTSTATATAAAGTATSTPTVCAVPFTDVPPDNIFYSYIEYLYCRGVVAGYNSAPPCPEGGVPCFLPNNNTSRGQLSKIVVLAFGLPIDTTGGPHFSDVPPTGPGSTFYPYIETLFNRGIIAGYENGTFRPSDPVTRGQLTKIVVNSAAQTNSAAWQVTCPSTATFEDVPVGSTFFCWIETAYSHGVISGYRCGQPPAGDCGPGNRPYFLPGNFATRAQISKIVVLAVTYRP